jgi:predicted nucleotidyltransferase
MSIPERWDKFSELPSNIKQRLAQLTLLLEREGVQLAYLFGSLGQGQPGHDVDLAILTHQGEPAFRLRPKITECLGTERVDLVDLRRASPVLRFEILRTGQLLYAADQALTERFELATLQVYRDTAWLRRQQRAYLRERMELWSSGERPSNNV